MKINKTIAIVLLLFGLSMGGLAAGVLFGQTPATASAASPAQKDDDAGKKDDGDKDDKGGKRTACPPVRGETVTIETARLYVEYNATDDDLGVHGAFDDAGWSKLCVTDPNGKQVLAVRPQTQLKDLTMAGIFFESREPPTSEFSFAELKAKFPEGQYEVQALSFDGQRLTGAATFTHDIPAPPAITLPAVVEDEENAGEAVVSSTDLVIEWQDVTETVDGGPVVITAYEIIITKVEHDDPHGFSRPIFDVHVPADRNSLSVPVEFLEPGTVYELEILA